MDRLWMVAVVTRLTLTNTTTQPPLARNITTGKLATSPIKTLQVDVTAKTTTSKGATRTK